MRALVVILCVLVIAVCSAGAFALRSVSRIWLRHLLERKPAGARLAERYLSRPQTLHVAAGGATALAAFLAGAAAGTAGGVLASVLWVVSAITAIAVLGVAVPRGLARRFPTRVVPVGLPVLRAADVLLSPLRALAEVTAGDYASAWDVVIPTEPAPHKDLEDLLREGQLEGVGDATEIAIISRLVQLGGKAAGDVMTPRAQLFALDAATPPHELACAVASSGYSRVPVYRDSLDDIVGLILAFDVLETTGETTPPLHPVFTASPEQACTALLARLLRAGVHMAVVRDATGVTLGIVTLEDLLEELVGDIRDEHDEPGPPEGEGSDAETAVVHAPAQARSRAG